jgi:hypothetical protein
MTPFSDRYHQKTYVNSRIGISTVFLILGIGGGFYVAKGYLPYTDYIKPFQRVESITNNVYSVETVYRGRIYYTETSIDKIKQVKCIAYNRAIKECKTLDSLKLIKCETCK